MHGAINLPISIFGSSGQVVLKFNVSRDTQWKQKRPEDHLICAIPVAALRGEPRAISNSAFLACINDAGSQE